MITSIGVLYVMFIAAFSLQIAGIVALSTSLYAFLVAAPFGIAAFIFTVLWEGIRYKNKIAIGFFAPGIIMTAAVVFELLNFYYHFTEVLSLFTLAGLLVFIIFLLILGIRYLRITINNAAEKKRLEDQIKFTNRQLAIQQEQYSGITESVDLARKARHDLRHQLSVIQGYNMADERELQRKYIDELIANIPTAYEKTICENFAVNAVAAYYIAMAESEGIEVDVQLRIPEDTGSVPALDLCVIVGNFIENALDACRRITDDGKYIRIRSRIDEDTISIVVTNSFDGVWNEKNGVYLSRKDARYKREGVGLSSVKAICEKHRGLVRIDAGKDSWKSSALIHF
jgi:sensor histidine kinase regulating citrate/malate metabolism